MLDNVNKRILFFDQSGKMVRTLQLDQTQEPIDFIVNNAGEVFVYGGDGGSTLRDHVQPGGELL